VGLRRRNAFEAIQRRGGAVDFLGADVGVAGRGLQVAVTEQFLDGQQVDARLEQVGRLAMPQGVRRDPLAQIG
jgi:hypothetical protein